MQRYGGMFASCIYGVQSGYERVVKAVSTKTKKHWLTKTTLRSCHRFVCSFYAFKIENARLLLGFLSVMRFDIPVIVTTNDKYSLRLL